MTDEETRMLPWIDAVGPPPMVVGRNVSLTDACGSASLRVQPQAAMYAVLTDAERERIRQIVAEEIAKVFPRLAKPDIKVPTCPDCGAWDLSEHDMTTPLDTAYRSWWCTCPKKVAVWELQCRQGLDDLLEAIHDPGDEIEAVLVEMSPEEFEELLARVKEKRG